MRFYTLSPVGGESADVNAPSAIRVARVTLPGEIDRPELVQRIDSTRLQMADNDRWAAPLGEMIRRTLSDDLRARVPAATGEPESLYVDIEEFIGGADCTVSLRAAWNIRAPKATEPSKRGYENVHIAAPSSCQLGALPQAMSRALAELADRIASARAK